MKCSVIGSGYVGLVTAACLAETGQSVSCVDIDASKIEMLNAGQIPFFERRLDELVAKNHQAGRLTFDTDVQGAIAASDVIFVAVGTPARPDGSADTDAVENVVSEISKHAARRTVLVLKSTVPVGTNERVRAMVRDSTHPIHVVSNPEFLKQGDAVRDFLFPERILVGCDADDTFARQAMEEIYNPVSLSGSRILWMNPSSAELSKYVANTMLAMRISFMNEVANLCESVGADIHDVRQAVGSDSRIGSRYLHAGPGYGGSCFPKDVKALMNIANQHGVNMRLPSATDSANQHQKQILAQKISTHFGDDLTQKAIAVWGLAFKPETDDMRESAAIPLIDALLHAGARVIAHDPRAGDVARARWGEAITIVEDPYEAVAGADALVLVTEWREYQHPDFERLKKALKHLYLLDGRNIWTRYAPSQKGFSYEGIGTQPR
jgi:UDPglucose 6-dehydrogenase